MTDPTARLRELGTALYEATRADLERSHSPARKRRRVLAGLGVAAVLVPAGAVAANALLSTDEVAKSLPAGTLAFAGTNPTCEVVVEQVEYHCVLDKPPGPLGAPENANDPAKYEVRGDKVRIYKDDGTQKLKDIGVPNAAPSAKDGDQLRVIGGEQNSKRGETIGDGKVRLDGPGAGYTAPQTENWLRAAMPTVDAANRVNGGCRGLDREGMTWQCYIGEAAVEEKIISRGFLGERVRGPGVG